LGKEKEFTEPTAKPLGSVKCAQLRKSAIAPRFRPAVANRLDKRILLWGEWVWLCKEKAVRKSLLALAVTLVGGASLGLTAGAGEADATLGKVGATRGICVLLGDRGCGLALDLARTSELTLYVQLAGADEVASAARAADAAGLYGTRILVAQGAPARIGLADNVADAVVAVGDPSGVSKAEVLRVLRPEGKAILGREEFVKPFPDGLDDWSHHYHAPDNNTQSRDRVARAPYLTQFVAEPRYGSAPQAAVASAGRLFMAFGHIAWHEREEGVLDTLVAVNGYNGTLLWKRPLPSGIMVDRSTMIATPTTLFLADDRSCKLLDPATGKVQDEIVAPADLTGGTFWKWMALENGVLYALVGQPEPPDAVAKWRSTGHGWPWGGISKGYNAGQYDWGFAKTLLAIDPKSKQVLWHRQEDSLIDSRATALKNGRLYISSFGKYVACLDAKTGKDIWRRTAEKDPAVFQAIGPYRSGHGYVEGWKTTAYLRCTDKALYFVGPQVQWLSALSADDGRVLWKHPAIDLHVVIRDDGLYTLGAQNKPDDTKKLDPLTGQVLATYKTHRRACTRATGSIDSIFFRGHEGSGRLDTAAGKTQWISPMRPSCHVGVVIANGQLYWLPWTCDCNLQMFGTIALGPAGDFPFGQKATDDRLERLESSLPPPSLPRVSAPREGIAESPSDWPTYRADNARRGVTQATIPDTVALLWQSEIRTKRSGQDTQDKQDGKEKAISDPSTPNPVNPVNPVQTLFSFSSEPTAPVAAIGLVFVAGTDGVVRALDAATGQPRWTAYAGGAVRYPPTVAEGRAFVGGGDGWAYCFEAATGRQLWRFRAAPAERRIPIFGSLVSTWPVASGVLVEDGTAYLAAGINDLDGTHVYALDAATGQLKWQNNASGHLDAWSRRGVACQGELLLHQGKLYLAGGNSVSPGIFDAATGKCLNNPPGGMGTSAPRGRELRLVNNNVAVWGQPLYSKPEFPVFDGSCRWDPPVVAAKNARLTLLDAPGAAGSPQPPRKGPEPPKAQGPALIAQGPNGAPLWTQPLPAPPVRWGIAVDAQGRIIVSLRNGQILCFGKKP